MGSYFTFVRSDSLVSPKAFALNIQMFNFVKIGADNLRNSATTSLAIRPRTHTHMCLDFKKEEDPTTCVEITFQVACV